MKSKKKINAYALSERIREYRKLRGYTQEELAALLDVSTVYISYLERAVTLPSLSMFVSLCKVLKVEASILLDGSLPTALQDDELEKGKLYKCIESLDTEQRALLIKFLNSMMKEEK